MAEEVSVSAAGGMDCQNREVCEGNPESRGERCSREYRDWQPEGGTAETVQDYSVTDSRMMAEM